MASPRRNSMTIHRIWNDLVQDESGQDLIEYALIAGVVGLAGIATLSTIAASIGKILTAVQGQLTTMGG
jgi:pilus assembly protein Flp/PilA